jgi:cell division protein FtsQ
VRGLSIVALAVLVTLVLVTRYWPSVNRVEVIGNVHHSRERILRLSGVAPGEPFLWVTRFGLRALAQDPWVLHTRVTRHWPDTIAISVVERQPVLTDGVTTWAADGTPLPDVPPALRAELPRLEGWGTPRLDEALELLAMLSQHGVEVITYTPEGFELVLANVILVTPSVEALRAQWSAFESQRGGRVAVYPWGVSSAP